jgi:hypothetical protein
LLDRSTETLSSVDAIPSTLDAKSAGTPHTVRDSFRDARDPVTSTHSFVDDIGNPPPATEAGGPVTAEDPAQTGESPIPHEEIGSGELIDADDATGAAGLDQVLESTHAGRKGGETQADEDEIVIADDLAEEVDDEALAKAEHGVGPDEDEEHTDAGATVPPFRSGS